MTVKWPWRLVLTGSAIAWAGTGLLGKPHTRPQFLCGIPGYDYQYGSYSQPSSALSFPVTEVLVEQRKPFTMGVPPTGLPSSKPVFPPAVFREKVRFYQLTRTRLQVDHCSLSRVALTLSEHGAWTLSLRADQNPWMTGPKNEVSNLRDGDQPVLTKETNSLKRNLFIVRVRCYGNYPLEEKVPALDPGKPVLLELCPPPFWVQRGEPYDFWYQDTQPLIRQYFDLIDRIEVEFVYRK